MSKRKTKKTSRIFFTSDLWLGRDNIIDIYERPFKSVTEMDYTIIKNWNDTVGENDLVFILGNIVYDPTKIRNILKRLNGTKILMLSEVDKICFRHDMDYVNDITEYDKIYMIDVEENNVLDNTCIYDKFGFLTSDEIFNICVNISERICVGVILLKNSIVDISRYGISISLYPLLDWNGKEGGSINLHGGLMKSSEDMNKDCRLSVRTDFWGFKPIELTEIKTLISQMK